ncbi:MAG TPA: sulfate ABC transporter permease subunit CysT [Planctomycetota bacterium]|nr:sulfate ABC transporter permease subunit CysT [Planctomycetota bacterium]
MKKGRTLPGFHLTMGATLAWLGILVLLPLGSLFFTAHSLSASEFWGVISSPRAMAAYRLTLGASLGAAVLNGGIGFLIAWVLVRYRFPGRNLVNGLIDIPFALPTAVAGLTYSSLWAQNGWLGRFLAPLGIKAVYSPLAVLIVLVFISLPFVVRSIQPVLEDLGTEPEEAAQSLGATRLQTFRWVLFPSILPALLTGIALAFARAVGEYGSVIFVSGNIPYRTEIASLLVVNQLEEFNFGGAASIAIVLLLASFAINGLINLLSRWSRRHE